MASPLLSIEKANNQARDRGALYQAHIGYILTVTTAATVNSGSCSVQRMPQTFVNYANVDDSYAFDFAVASGVTACSVTANLEYELGSLTLSGGGPGTFSAGVSAPTKTPAFGSSGTCVFNAVMLYISTALTATTPVITITYTDQAGNTGNTATLTLPTNAAVNSAYLVYPHLAAGDTGITAITNMSHNTGTAGVIKATGLLELASVPIGPNGSGMNDIRNTQKPIYPVSAGETIAFYTYDNTATNNTFIEWVMVPTT